MAKKKSMLDLYQPHVYFSISPVQLHAHYTVNRKTNESILESFARPPSSTFILLLTNLKAFIVKQVTLHMMPVNTRNTIMVTDLSSHEGLNAVSAFF